MEAELSNLLHVSTLGDYLQVSSFSFQLNLQAKTDLGRPQPNIYMRRVRNWGVEDCFLSGIMTIMTKQTQFQQNIKKQSWNSWNRCQQTVNRYHWTYKHSSLFNVLMTPIDISQRTMNQSISSLGLTITNDLLPKCQLERLYLVINTTSSTQRL